MDDRQTLRSLVRDDAYEVLRVLAEGPAGRTELVALDGEGPLVRKRIPLELANAAAWAQVMDLEESLLPRVESLYRMPDELVVVYEYVSGLTLRELVERDGPLGPYAAARIVCDLCWAAEALHERGVIHRDIAPNNVVVASDGRAHLIDLGIARHHKAAARRDTTRLGTWSFAAPEQFGFAQTDARSDVYALGRLLGFLLTGIEPDTEEHVRRMSDPERVSPMFTQVVNRAAAFEPSARFASAAELREAVERAAAQVSGEPSRMREVLPVQGSGVMSVSPPAPTAAPTFTDADALSRLSKTPILNYFFVGWPPKRSFSSLAGWAKAILVVIWTTAALLALLVVFAKAKEPPQSVSEQVGVLCAKAVFVLGGFSLFKESFAMATSTAPYRRRWYDLLVVLVRVAAVVGVVLAASFIVAIVADAIFS